MAEVVLRDEVVGGARCSLNAPLSGAPLPRGAR